MINKHIKIVLMFAFIALIIVAFGCVAFAHSGGTDGQGGHTDQSTGEYHYHHGYPAHQHDTFGNCPYKNQNSSSGSGNSAEDIIMILFFISLGLTLISYVIHKIFDNVVTEWLSGASALFAMIMLVILLIYSWFIQ